MSAFKKLLFIGLLFSTPCYAGTISLATISADATAAGFNNNYTILSNVVNGNIEGSTDGGATVSNIKADSVFEINMADDANGRVRDSELFGIGVDTIAGGAISSQSTVVESGCVQATDSDLTADVSACVAYINGYRVSKSATSQTYSNNTTTYLWLSQTGVYNQSTNPDTTIANSALIAKVVTSGGAITTVTNFFTTRLPGLIIPSDYRVGMVVSKDSATTLTVGAGHAEVNNLLLTKTSATTLTLTTAGDWAGGSSLRAASTYGFVGIDASGNLKMHTTAPTHENYAVSVTEGKKRYATWSSTVYRILGWFYMDGSQNIENASNIKEADVHNSVQSNDTSVVPTFNSTTFSEVSRVNFYNSGGPILISSTVSADLAGGGLGAYTEFARSGTVLPGTGTAEANSASENVNLTTSYTDENRPQGTVTYANHMRVNGNSTALRRRLLRIQEL